MNQSQSQKFEPEDSFEQLLERIRQQRHPEYGSLEWNGQSRQATVNIRFENEGDDEATVRRRALTYLRGLTPEERANLNIEIVYRKNVPVRAVIRGKTSNLNPDRLRGLDRMANGKQGP